MNKASCDPDVKSLRTTELEREAKKRVELLTTLQSGQEGDAGLN